MTTTQQHSARPARPGLRRLSAGAAAMALCVTGPVAAPMAQDAGAATEAFRGVRITADQERSTTRGLEWLAGNQNADGSWDGDVGYKRNESYVTTREQGGHVGVTALAGMAFLAGGHLPGRGEYGPVVDRAVDYILRATNQDGYITSAGTRMYSHAFATLFLAQVCGMTHREDTRQRLQKAVDFIVKGQNELGGWRYEPLARDADMSIVVCQCLALRAARNIGIRVPKGTIDAAVMYVVDSAEHGHSGPRSRRNQRGTFTYKRGSASRTNYSLTAAGVTALNGLGIYSDELIDRGIEFLHDEFASFNRRYGTRGHYFFWYGHYYGVQAMYTKGGHDWVTYFTPLREFLLGRQRADGSWANGTGPGPAFSTAMACLILEIPYDFLPIFHR